MSDMTNTSKQQGPEGMQQAGQFVPTTVLRSGSHQYSDSDGSLSTSQASDAVLLTPAGRRRSDGELGSGYAPQGTSTSRQRAGIIGPYPHNDQEIARSSWWFRTTRSLTGDLGPIEHQGGRTERMATTESGQHQSTASSERMGDSATGDANDTSHRFASTSELVADREDHRREVAEAEQPQSQQQQRSWFGGSTEDVNGATAEAAAALKRGVDNAGAAIKQAVGSTRDWLQGASKAVDDAAAGASRGMEQAADETSAWMQSKGREAEAAVNDAARTIERQTDDMRAGIDKAAGDARGWWDDQKEGAQRATDNARSWMHDRQQEAERAADDAHGWWRDQKREADNAVGTAATEMHDWAARTKDSFDASLADANESLNRTADRSRAWYYEQMSDTAQAVANAAGSVQRRASDARQRAHEMAPPESTDGGDHRPARRPDSLFETKGSAVLQALDSRFDDARNALRNASQDLRNAAEGIPHPHATNEGLVDAGNRGSAGFVESGSGIPTISNSKD